MCAILAVVADQLLTANINPSNLPGMQGHVVSELGQPARLCKLAVGLATRGYTRVHRTSGIGWREESRAQI
jgi:hypothetical protein